MRELTDHIVNPANDRLLVAATDAPGHGGANHHYVIDVPGRPVDLRFQNGPISEDGNGINGITNESLLAVVIDRLHGFQNGQYRCKENACALTHIEEAMHWLKQRTLARMRRGVEGTHTV